MYPYNNTGGYYGGYYSGNFTSYGMQPTVPYGTMSGSYVAPQSYSQRPPQSMSQPGASPAELQAWFRAVDRDNSGTISVTELQTLQFGGRSIEYKTACKLMKVFDRDGNFSIDFNEYVNLHYFIQSLQFAFVSGDKDGSGFLDFNEIGTALSATGFNLSPETFKLFYQKYSLGSNAGIPFTVFLDLAADLALLRKRFQQLDNDKDGWIGVTYDQLLSISADL
eukprot:TRINITY_DN672_c0_g1_i2.p2 TRINITY_DN672_c0_g1~~TRINITY_DN672_c0_g1_i2.p2  ORF type:complete len:222 (+),score=91.49 TRINITY_DN672_c0_g1_i2:71-736(+)